MDNLNGEKLNSIRTIGPAKINSLNIKSLDASMKADNLRSVGKLKLIYDNLKVTALKEDGTRQPEKEDFYFYRQYFHNQKENEEGNPFVWLMLQG
jgi:hypothetical protein